MAVGGGYAVGLEAKFPADAMLGKEDKDAAYDEESAYEGGDYDGYSFAYFDHIVGDVLSPM